MNKRGILIFTIIIAVLLSLILVIYYKNVSNQDFILSNSQYNINFSAKIDVSLDKSIKNVEPNIIKAARAALLYTEIDSSKYSHYNNNIKYYVNFFEVIKSGNNNWEVKFRIKQKKNEAYDTSSYSIVDVEKTADGSYVGSIMHSSPIDNGETY